MNPFLNETIDKNVPVPMYYQLKKIIQDMIKSGKLKPQIRVINLIGEVTFLG